MQIRINIIHGYHYFFGTENGFILLAKTIFITWRNCGNPLSPFSIRLLGPYVNGVCTTGAGRSLKWVARAL